jgi:hypothetical protein
MQTVFAYVNFSRLGPSKSWGFWARPGCNNTNRHWVCWRIEFHGIPSRRVISLLFLCPNGISQSAFQWLLSQYSQLEAAAYFMPASSPFPSATLNADNNLESNQSIADHRDRYNDSYHRRSCTSGERKWERRQKFIFVIQWEAELLGQLREWVEEVTEGCKWGIWEDSSCEHEYNCFCRTLCENRTTGWR